MFLRFIFLPIFLSLCHANDENSAIRVPSYHELYTEKLKSISFASRLIDFNWYDLKINQSNFPVDGNFSSSFSESVLNFILQRPDFLSEASTDCVVDFLYLAESLKRFDRWALAVVDAFGKLPSGLLSGDVIWAGDYEECLDVRAPASNISMHIGPLHYQHEATFDGQYCLLSIVSNAAPPPPVPEGYLLGGLTIGLCVSSRCTEKMLTSAALEVEKLVSQTLAKVGLQVGGVVCPKKREHLDSNGVIAVVILAVMLFLVAAGTAYEYFTLRRRARAAKAVLDDADVTLSTSQNGSVTADDVSLIDGSADSQSVIRQVITSFSLITNGRRIFASSVSSRSTSNFMPLASGAATTNLQCLHGIRFLSMAWIILGNTYYFSFAMSSNPIDRLDPNKRDFWFQAIIQAAYACDTFFLISACLVATQFFAIADRFPHVIGTCTFWLQFYLQRFMRLTPPYMVILFVYLGLWKYVGEGPFWPREGFEVEDCSRTWWSNLLYINNYLNVPIGNRSNVVTGREYCAAWTWYLANDMQLFWISPLVLYPLFKSRQHRRWTFIGYGILALFVVLGLAVTGIIARVNELPPNMFPADLALRDKAEFMRDELYFKPYPHLPCYALGILLALALRRYRQLNIQGHGKLTVFIGWSLSFSFGMAIIYGLWPEYRGHPFSVDLSACYAATSRTVFAACVAWVAYACLTGHGGIINDFLSWSFFVVLSRLSFCAYLIHPMLLFAYFFSRRTTFFYTEFVMVWFFGSFLLFSYLAAIGVALVFEYPFLTLNRRFIKRSE